jgi:protein-S-isoprenylcysteine O-methyltransferase Ste14
MKTKTSPVIISIIVFVLTAYVLPLSAKVESLRTVQVLVLVLIASVLMFVIYRYRIDAEEETLVEGFGDDYKQYQSETAKLIPFLY